MVENNEQQENVLSKAVAELLNNDQGMTPEPKVKDDYTVLPTPKDPIHPLKKIPEVEDEPQTRITPQNMDISRLQKEIQDLKDENAKRRISERTAIERATALENEKILDSMDREQRLEFLAQDAVNKKTALERELKVERIKNKVMNYVTGIGVKDPLTIAELIAPSLSDKDEITNGDIEGKVGSLINSFQTEKKVYNIGNGIQNPDVTQGPLKDVIKYDPNAISDTARKLAEEGKHEKALMQRVTDIFTPFLNKGG
jgi:hypothetical protein